MKISVITVSYNSSDTLEKTIISVLEQSYKEIEYIVIDGASTDGSLEILERYNDRISFWCSEPDTGMYEAMNKGVKHATGEYLFFLNSDDFFSDTNVVRRVVGFLEKDNVDLLYGYIRLLYPTYHVERSFSFTDRMLSKGNIPPHQSSFFRRVLFEELGGYAEGYKSAADLDFYCRLKRRGCLSRKTDIVVARMNSGGASSQKELAYKEAREIIREYYGVFRANLFLVKKIYIEQGVKKILQRLKLDLIYDKFAQINNILTSVE